MNLHINLDAYSDALVVLATAGILIPIMHRWRLNPVIGYLVAGAILGPLGLGSFIKEFPFLYWVTVVDAKNVAGIAELGVVFLLFLIGLELSFERLKAMRRLVFGLGSLQIIGSAAVIGLAAHAFGLSAAAAVIIGACLALSSTAIIIESLSSQGRLMTSAGRASFSILLAQDLAVIPILLFVSIFGSNSGGSVMETLGYAMLDAVIAVALIIVVGRLILRSLFHVVASTQTSELFVAATLFVIIATAVGASLAGLSMPFGAFLAGLILAETEFRKAIETTMKPFKGLLLGLFFFTVGMGIDVRDILRQPLDLAAAVTALVLVKSLIIFILCRLFRLSSATAVETAILLGPGGEFAFVGIGMAAAAGIVAGPVASFALVTTSLTMALIPLLAMLARQLAAALQKNPEPDPKLETVPEDEHEHVIVVGHGRVGQVVCDLLSAHNIPHIAIDSDAEAVRTFQKQGRRVFFGDATSVDFLRACGLAQARAVIVTIGVAKETGEIAEQVRSLRPDVALICRARDAGHAIHLYRIGVTDAVPETIEASLQLSESVLLRLGLPTDIANASVHDKREQFKAELQKGVG